MQKISLRAFALNPLRVFAPIHVLRFTPPPFPLTPPSPMLNCSREFSSQAIQQLCRLVLLYQCGGLVLVAALKLPNTNLPQVVPAVFSSPQGGHQKT